MEGLGLVETEAVESTVLVSVHVGFGGPAGTVPQLTVSRIATGKFVASTVFDFKFAAFVKLLSSVAISPVRAVMRYERGLETLTEGCVLIVDRLEVQGRGNHGALAITAGGCVELFVNAAHITSVETGSSQTVNGFVNNIGLEDFTSLFGNSLTQMVIVDMDTRTVTLVTGNNS